MKSLVEYIREQLEVENGRNGYKIVTLVRRENIDLANISEENFVKFIKEDFKKAVDEYTNVVKPYNEKRIAELIERDVNLAIKFAEKKWKTEKKRNEYVENIRKNAEQKKWYVENPERIFFDFKPTPAMGISSNCIIDKSSSDDTLKRAYEELKKDKYFTRGKGWAFKYETSDEKNPYSFRPWIDVLLSDNDKEEQKRDEENLTKAVEDFYKDTKYWGD